MPAAHRRRVAALAATGLAISVYLALFQLGALGSPWDPVFGERSSRHVLELMHPVPDAAAGALAYLTELVLLALAWRSDLGRALLALVVCAAGLTSLVLIGLQALDARDWCLLCLGSAAVSLTILAISVRELGHVARWARTRRDER